MATYVVGDVHGQLDPLLSLIEKLELRSEDHLWLTGDLVNRGPSSLETLRWARAEHERHGDRRVLVLGNHDLRLLATAAGLGPPRRRDTFDEILAAPDLDELCLWLRRRPLLHRRNRHILVHAGLLPSWTPEEAEARAREAEEELRGDAFVTLLRDWRIGGPVPDPQRERRRRTLSTLTGIRTCDRDKLCRWKGPPAGAPPGCVPWFRAPQRRSSGVCLMFGHWAALGVLLEPRIKALDSGAAWGQRLTALRLEDDALFQVPISSLGRHEEPSKPGREEGADR